MKVRVTDIKQSVLSVLKNNNTYIFIHFCALIVLLIKNNTRPNEKENLRSFSSRNLLHGHERVPLPLSTFGINSQPYLHELGYK